MKNILNENKSKLTQLTEELENIRKIKEKISSDLLDSENEIKKLKKENMLLKNNFNFNPVNNFEIEVLDHDKEKKTGKKNVERNKIYLDEENKITEDLENKNLNFAKLYIHNTKVNYFLLLKIYFSW